MSSDNPYDYTWKEVVGLFVVFGLIYIALLLVVPWLEKPASLIGKIYINYTNYVHSL